MKIDLHGCLQIFFSIVRLPPKKSMNFLLIFRQEQEKITNFCPLPASIPIPSEILAFLLKKGLDRTQEIRYTLSTVSLC